MAEIRADLVGDSRSLVKSIDKVGDALDDAVDDLAKLDKAGDQTEAQLESNFRDIAKAGKKAGDKVGRDLGEGFKEAKSEAASSGREAAASFGGGIEDVGDFVQETLANALGGFGPLGAAAGVALAAGLGAALQGLADQQQQLEEMREAAKDLAQTLYENNGRLPLEEQVSKLFDTLTKERRAQNIFESIGDQWADLGTVLDDVRGTATQLNRPLREVVKALSGNDVEASKQLIADIADEMKRLDENSEGANLWDVAGKQSELKSVSTELQKQVDLLDLAADSAAAVGSAYTAPDSAYVQKVEGLSSAWETANDNAGDYFGTTEKGATTFDFSGWVKGLQDNLKAADNVKADLVGLPDPIKAEAERIWTEQGPVAASAFTDSFLAQSTKNRQAAVDALSKTGTNAGTALAKAAEAAAKNKAQGWGAIPFTVVPRIDDSAIKYYRPPMVHVPWKLQTSPSGRQAV